MGPLHYLFGYGSLIHPDSRRKTTQRYTRALPVHVAGFRRCWSYNCRDSYTAVAVVQSPDDECNGVIFPIHDPEHELKKLDAREVNYMRTSLSLSQCRLSDHLSPEIQEEMNTWPEFSGFFTGDCIVWLYELPISSQPSKEAAESVHLPSPDIPIPQSYVDCILDGCLIFGHEFAVCFLKTTRGWCAAAWLNDRHLHHNAIIKYRPDVVYNYSQIDAILHMTLPEIMQMRRKNHSHCPWFNFIFDSVHASSFLVK